MNVACHFLFGELNYDQQKMHSMKISQTEEINNLIFIIKLDFPKKNYFIKSCISPGFFIHGYSYSASNTHYTGLAEYVYTQPNLLKPFA
jgi:hypothetical protein